MFRRRPSRQAATIYSLKRSYYTLDGQPVDLSTVEQGARVVAVLDVTTTESQGARLVLDDPLPAGFEIDNPHVLSGGDVAALDWLNLVNNPAHVEFRADRFVAAWDLPPSGTTQFQFAYIVRAVSPGTFLHPAALIEDMYRPERRGRTDTGKVEVVGPAEVDRRCCDASAASSFPPPLRGRVREGGQMTGAAAPFPPLRLSPARGERDAVPAFVHLFAAPFSPPASSLPRRRSR